MVNNSPGKDPGAAVAAAIELLVRQGYDATSVDDLANAAGISRSTFFRRFGSKEDMVFADHERILARVGDYLSHSRAEPLQAVAEAGAMVFEHHMRHGATSLARHHLLQQVPALRERELVTSHRYERAFRLYLQSALPDNKRRDYGAVAAAAAMVAVHNSFLRQWLRAPDVDLRDRLVRELHALAETFRPALYDTAGAEGEGAAVVVAVFEAGTSKERILDAVRHALP